MSGKIMIVGTGNVGASIAYALINQRTPVNELILTDINTADAEGEAMDLRNALAVSPSWLKITASTYREASDCDICIITAGANQKPGETRTDLLQKNARILHDVITQVMETGFTGIFLIVSNPMDTLTFLTQAYSDLPFERVIGSGTILDSARLRFAISEALQVHPKSVHAHQIGEHGDSEFAVLTTANVGGEKVTQLLPQTKLDQIEEAVRLEAYEIIKRKGATHYGVGSATVQIINSILNDERRILNVSNYDDNTNTYYGYPAVVGRTGVIKRLELKLSEQEGIKLQRSINQIQQTIHDAKKFSY